MSNEPVKKHKDDRFAKFQSDPKFSRAKYRDLKVKLDDRFNKQDLEIKRKAKVDKYGRRVKGNTTAELEDFDKYFEQQEKEKTTENDTLADPSNFIVDRARGEIPEDYTRSSDEYTSSESETSGESEIDSDEDEVLGDVEKVSEINKPESGEATKTLAVVNLDWDHVHAYDLLATFNSFVPKYGKIERVCIYPSEFGKERMRKEDQEGPPRDLFKKSKSKHKDNADDSDSEVDIKDLYEEGDAEKEVDTKALRRYQLERLRYFYAVVYCKDLDTARAIYENCDGTEYESTANIFDIRYVPDTMEFDEEDIKEYATEVPKNYTPLDFSTDALQHSNVKLTWDDTPADRIKIAKKAFSQKEIDEMDFKAYLASDSEDSDNNINDSEAKDKLKALVGNVVKKNKQNDESDGDMDLEITFTPGLEKGEINNTAASESEETTIDKVKRKEKERRKARKQKLKELKQQSLEKKKTERSRKKDDMKPVDEKAKAQLELIMMDDKEDSEKSINKKAHFNMKELLRSEKEKGKKGKYQDKNRIVDDEFKPDLNDPRFAEMFEDHDFAIDPSQPEFQSTSAMRHILQERNKRSKHKSKNGAGKRVKTDKSSRDAQEVNNLIERIKRKGQN